MDFIKSLFGAKKNVPAANSRTNNRKNMVPAPAANMMVVTPVASNAPPAPPAPPMANAPQQFGGRKRTRKNKKGRKARKTTRKARKGSC